MMIDEVFSTLVSAWRVSVVASVLLLAALAIAPYWDSAVYLKALHQTLAADPM